MREDRERKERAGKERAGKGNAVSLLQHGVLLSILAEPDAGVDFELKHPQHPRILPRTLQELLE